MDHNIKHKMINEGNLWLDTESDHSVCENWPRGNIGYSIVGLEDTARLDQEDEEHKNDLIKDFVDIIKFKDSSGVTEFLKQNKIKIQYEDRPMYIYMLVLLKGDEHYVTVNDFFDNGFQNIQQPEESLIKEEPPDSIDEIKINSAERDKMRSTAFEIALKGRHKYAVQFFINSDGENIKISPGQLYQLYELGFSYLYKALIERVKINRPKQSAANMIIEGFKKEHDLNEYSSINDSDIHKINQNTMSSVTYVDILDVLLEKGANNLECRRIISKITDNVILSEIVGLLIMKGRLSLMTEMIKENSIEYDRKFIILSIEYDQLDITFRLRDTYPQSFAADEDSYLEAIILSFTKSNYCWLAK